VPLVLFAWPNEATESNDYAIEIPYLGSLILTHSLDGKIEGLKDFPPDERPPVVPVFFSFRIMVGLGFLMLAVAVIGAILWWRGRLFEKSRYLGVVQHLWPIGFIAIITGWIVAETGRQPWVVTGVLRTADAASPVPAGSVAASLTLFVLVYGVVFSAGIYYINRLLIKGPQVLQPGEEGETARRPLSYASDEVRAAMQRGE
jgi:cytochrome d ubiquinol oxidase subunit I